VESDRQIGIMGKMYCNHQIRIKLIWLDKLLLTSAIKRFDWSPPELKKKTM